MWINVSQEKIFYNSKLLHSDSFCTCTWLSLIFCNRLQSPFFKIRKLRQVVFLTYGMVSLDPVIPLAPHTWGEKWLKITLNEASHHKVAHDQSQHWQPWRNWVHSELRCCNCLVVCIVPAPSSTASCQDCLSGM